MDALEEQAREEWAASRLKSASEALAERFENWKPTEPEDVDLEDLDPVGGVQ